MNKGVGLLVEESQGCDNRGFFSLFRQGPQTTHVKENDFENEIILFGRNSQNLLGLIRSIGEKGILPHCVMMGGNNGLASLSKYSKQCHFVKNASEGYEYILKNFSNLTPKPIILCSGDIAQMMIDQNVSSLKKHFIIPTSNEDGKLTELMSKRNVCAYAKQFGFNIPWMVTLNKTDPIPDSIVYPVFTKSEEMNARRKDDEHKCNNKVELQKVLDNCYSQKILVQQFIDKVDEIDYIGYVANGEVYIPYIQHQLRFSDHAYGGYHQFDQIDEKDTIVNRVKDMLKSIDFQGLFSVEFLIDNTGKWYFTEINFRHDGHDYLITNVGINLPWLYCCAVTDRGAELQPSVKKSSFTGINELLDLKQFVATRRLSRVKWLKQFITADSHIIWNRFDRGVNIFLIKQIIKSFL